MDIARSIRLTGAAGMCGASLLLAADWTMLGTFTSGADFNRRWLTLLSEMPAWRVTLGGLAGPIGAWLYVIGFWQLYIALQPAGRWLAFLAFAGFSLSFVWIAGAFHTSFPFMADAWLASQARSGGGGEAVRAATEHAFAYAGLLYYGGLLPAAVGVAVLAYAVLRRQTRYARWFAAFNPAILFVITLAFRWIPAPLGGLLVIGAGNLAFLLFFAASTYALRGSAERGPPRNS